MTRAVTATFAPAGVTFLPSGAALTQTVEAARTSIGYTGATTGDFHDPAVVSARLTRSRDGAPIAAGSVRFTIASQTCSATTDSDGRASCAIVIADPAGPNTVQASYAGACRASHQFCRGLRRHPSDPKRSDRHHRTSRLHHCLDVAATRAGVHHRLVRPARLLRGCVGDPVNYHLAFPAFGAFVVGDRVATLSNRVTFYDSDWSERNSTTGGESPDSFKGFAATPGPLPQCSGLFAATPGRSTKPPSTLPAYMGTIVTSSVTKNGSSITGPGSAWSSFGLTIGRSAPVGLGTT